MADPISELLTIVCEKHSAVAKFTKLASRDLEVSSIDGVSDDFMTLSNETLQALKEAIRLSSRVSDN